MARRNGGNKESFGELNSELTLGGRFQFISIQNPDDVKDRKAKRRARSHAVARGIENKRKLQLKPNQVIQPASHSNISSQATSKVKQSQSLITSPYPLAISSRCPFQTFTSESPRLHALLYYHKAQRAAFTVSDELVLQHFRCVLRDRPDDNALLSAFMLTFAFAITTGSIDSDSLRYQNDAMTSIRHRISSLDKAISEATLGAILLLAGIEARLGMPHQVQLHMEAIQHLLEICRAKCVYLSDGIKRAIFWQDLNASVMSGSRRVVDHTTFSELHWKRDPFSPVFYILPPGFTAQSDLLGEDFIEILKDLYALRCIREYAVFSKDDVASMAHIDSHQASIQSRIAQLIMLPSTSSVPECCQLAAYLCSTMVRCKVWPDSTIPLHLSSQLLHKLQQASEDPVWDDRPNLLTWILYIGGGFAPTGSIRSEYVVLLHMNLSTRLQGLYTSWEELLDILKQFIWSDKSFLSHVKGFWEESLSFVLSRRFDNGWHE